MSMFWSKNGLSDVYQWSSLQIMEQIEILPNPILFLKEISVGSSYYLALIPCQLFPPLFGFQGEFENAFWENNFGVYMYLFPSGL